MKLKYHSNFRLSLLALLVSALMFSCQKEDVLVRNIDEVQYLSESDMEGMMKLGKQLQNPYSVENMRKAWETLKANGRVAGEDIDITVSHLYLRFMPQTEEELDILNTDSTLVMYDYPLDYEIEEAGDFYHDPAVPIDQPTYQYLAVPVDKVLPDGVEYEVLAELFIPDEDIDGETGRIDGHLSVATILALVDEALRITGNLEESSDGRIFRRRRWRPKDTIKVWDDIVSDYVSLCMAWRYEPEPGSPHGRTKRSPQAILNVRKNWEEGAITASGGKDMISRSGTSGSLVQNIMDPKNVAIGT